MKEEILIENEKKDNNISRDLTGILDIIICLLLFISSIYKGAFYKSDFLFPNVAISLVGAIYLIYKIVKEIMSKQDFKPKSRIRILLDLGMLLLPAMYCLPIIFKTYVSLPDSIYEMLRYVNMTIIYYISRNSKNHKIYFNVFFVIAVIQMILGIDQITTRTFEEFLNGLSTGYLPDTERLSGTLQYANITGIVIGLGLIYCFNKTHDILKQQGKIKDLKLFAAVYMVLLGLSCVILTESRIATITILGIMILDSIFNFFCVNKTVGIFKFSLTIYSFLVSGLVEKFIMQQSNLSLYIAVLLLSIVFVVLYRIIAIIYVFSLNRANKAKKVIKNRTIVICLIITGVMCLSLMISLPKNVVLKKSNNTNSSFVKNIYEFETGENIVEFKVKSLVEDTRFTVWIDAVSDGYETLTIGTYNYYDNTSGTFKSNITIPENTEKLVVKIEAQKGNLQFGNFRLNGEKYTLSYLLLPDEMLGKIQETIYGVYGDELRLNYVKDTFKLLKNSPIIGVGGEGFKHTYGSVQESSYISSEAHSAILQALVEVGIVGTAIFVVIIALSVCICIKLILKITKIPKQERNNVILPIWMYFTLISVIIFDLAFSYAFMIYLFGVATAILVKTYLDVIAKHDISKKQKSSIDWSYVKIVVLSVSTVALIYAGYFSFNAYRASLIRIPNRGNDLSAKDVAENIAYLELKNEQDKYDIDYMNELNDEYGKYKTILTEAIVNAGNNNEIKEELQLEKRNLVINIKNNADKMLEYEYYDKFVLNDVADVYVYNYIEFVDIYEEQFSSKEVAYAFYLNYVLKLADRIVEINPHSKKANEMYNNMCIEYISELEKDNKYLQSNSVATCINELKSRIGI